MSVSLLRRIVIVVCGCGIAGMIVSSIADSTAAAMTFGLLAAVAAGGLILVTAVVGPPVERPDADLAEAVETELDALTASGADEPALRELVRKAVLLGRIRQGG